MASDFDIEVLNTLIRDYPHTADTWLREVGEQILGDVKLSMLESPADGATYKRGKGRTHTASSAGSPPRPDMGALINSLRVERVGELHYELRDGVEYGYWLEVGTERMGARPFVSPVFADWQGKIADDAMRRIEALK